jgi:hypothetical protein
MWSLKRVISWIGLLWILILASSQVDYLFNLLLLLTIDDDLLKNSSLGFQSMMIFFPPSALWVLNADDHR